LPLVDAQPGAPWLHLYTEAARLALADRAQFVGDPQFVSAPEGGWASVLDDAPLQLASAGALYQPQNYIISLLVHPIGDFP
jgi:gamma-glutamyltranspeptidase/glutathione hydrolase